MTKINIKNIVNIITFVIIRISEYKVSTIDERKSGTTVCSVIKPDNASIVNIKNKIGDIQNVMDAFSISLIMNFSLYVAFYKSEIII